jgi:hypothetical protein
MPTEITIRDLKSVGGVEFQADLKSAAQANGSILYVNHSTGQYFLVSKDTGLSKCARFQHWLQGFRRDSGKVASFVSRHLGQLPSTIDSRDTLQTLQTRLSKTTDARKGEKIANTFQQVLSGFRPEVPALSVSAAPDSLTTEEEEVVLPFLPFLDPAILGTITKDYKKGPADPSMLRFLCQSAMIPLYLKTENGKENYRQYTSPEFQNQLLNGGHTVIPPLLFERPPAQFKSAVQEFCKNQEKNAENDQDRHHLAAQEQPHQVAGAGIVSDQQRAQLQKFKSDYAADLFFISGVSQETEIQPSAHLLPGEFEEILANPKTSAHYKYFQLTTLPAIRHSITAFHRQYPGQPLNMEDVASYIKPEEHRALAEYIRKFRTGAKERTALQLFFRQLFRALAMVVSNASSPVPHLNLSIAEASLEPSTASPPSRSSATSRSSTEEDASSDLPQRIITNHSFSESEQTIFLDKLKKIEFTEQMALAIAQNIVTQRNQKMAHIVLESQDDQLENALRSPQLMSNPNRAQVSSRLSDLLKSTRSRSEARTQPQAPAAAGSSSTSASIDVSRLAALVEELS